eukprot:2563619-Prymnesium_polylepis.1
MLQLASTSILVPGLPLKNPNYSQSPRCDAASTPAGAPPPRPTVVSTRSTVGTARSGVSEG